jgi:uncharacterized protein YjbJ (UPF0337 family)
MAQYHPAMDHDVPNEAPATWENVVVGKAKEAIGRVADDPELTQEGEDQVAVAHQVREDFEDNG